MLARPTLFRTRDVALVVAATALAAVLGVVVVSALTSEPLGPLNAPAPAQPAPVREPAPQPSFPAQTAPAEQSAGPQESAPPAPALAPPTTSAVPAAPAQESQPAGATRQPFERLPADSAVPSFRPGGNLGPPYIRIPPQN